MIPSSVLGLLLFAVVLGPGYVWIRYSEKRSARPSRSGVLEAADVIFVGLLASGLSLLVLFAVGPLVGFSTFGDVVRDRETFLTDQPYEAVGGGLFVLLLGTVGSLVVASAVHRGRSKSIRPGSTVWHDVFGAASSDLVVSVSVEMDDGRIVDGRFFSHLMDDEATDVDLALEKPLYVWEVPPEGASRGRLKLPADRVVVPSARIVAVWATYLSTKRESES